MKTRKVKGWAIVTRKGHPTKYAEYFQIFPQKKTAEANKDYFNRTLNHKYRVEPVELKINQ